MSQADWNDILPNRSDFNKHTSLCKCGEPVYDHGLCYQCLAEIDEQNAIEKRREMLEIRAEGDR